MSKICDEVFKIRVGVHQGFDLSPYLFYFLMNEVIKEMYDEIPWCMMFINGKVLVGDNLAEIN